jgi:hypothetical protein
VSHPKTIKPAFRGICDCGQPAVHDYYGPECPRCYRLRLEANRERLKELAEDRWAEGRQTKERKAVAA